MGPSPLDLLKGGRKQSQREFDVAIRVDLIFMHDSVWRRSPYSWPRRASLVTQKGLRSGKLGGIKLSAAWSTKVHLGYASPTGTALFHRFSHWDLCLFCHWGLRRLVAFSQLILLNIAFSLVCMTIILYGPGASWTQADGNWQSPELNKM